MRNPLLPVLKQRNVFALGLVLFLVSFTVRLPAGSLQKTRSADRESTDPYWIQQCADCRMNLFIIGDQSMVLDRAGHPHVAYVGDHAHLCLV